MRISVVITAYNAAPFIRDAVRSVLDQTCQDFECLVVDDGSDDGTLQALREIPDPRLRVISQGRLGRGRALNLGLRESRGEYIAIQDADDLSHPRRLEIQLAAIERSPEYAVVGSAHILMGEGGSPAWADAATGRAGIPMREVSGSLVFLNPLSHSALLMRRAALERVKGYDEKREDLFDYDLLIRLAAEGFKLGKLPVPLAAKRIHPRQFFEGRNRVSYVLRGVRLQNEAVKALGRSPLLRLLFPFSFGYRMLPGGLRMWLRRVFVPCVLCLAGPFS